jgi:aldehyde dehydrogenase (NAD+)
MTDVAAIRLQNLIAGQWRSGHGERLISRNPADPSVVVAEGNSASTAEVEEAIVAARQARRGWSALPIHQRGAVLLAAAADVDRNAPEWGLELAREEGKTKAEAIGEVLRAAQILRYYGNEGDRSTGEMFASPRAGEHILVTRKPVGVVAVITPFNFPIAIPAWKVAPALVYGNTVVWKPASTVPLLALRLAEALQSAGLPPGCLNLVHGESEVGEHLVGHSGIDAISFTGSTGVGRRIAATAAARGVPVQAEMGGKNAAIVLDDADFDLAIEQVMLGAFRSTGQKCTATSRLIVTNGIADRFIDALVNRAGTLVVGDPTGDSTQIGPVITDAAQARIQSGIEAAQSAGARLLAGGVRYTDGPLSQGYFVSPTVLETKAPTRLWAEELFGPVLAVRRAETVEEAFALADEGELGLSAAVFTQDVTRALDVVDNLDVGVLHINSESAGADPHVPFGGAKKSGLGPKEQGRAARDFFTHTTTVYLRGGQPGN